MQQQAIVKKDRSEIVKQLKMQHDRDRELLTGKFIFHEVPGGRCAFPYRAYKEDEVEFYDFVDGGVYKIPRGVAKHLNKNCWYPVHAHYSTENGTQVKIGQKVRRMSFQSLEFLDPEDIGLDKDLVTVEKVK